MVCVVAGTIGVRLWPLLARHMLGGLLEYDDGAYYNAAAHLMGGLLPYRHFIFLQPPGIVLLLAPFAALARVAGDPAALVAARLGIVCVASVNVLLLMRLVRRSSGPVAAVAAGATYAAWGVAAAAERTVLLEPLLGLGLLSALTFLSSRAAVGRTRRDLPAMRVAAAGLTLGLALTVKTWAVVDLVVVGGWLLWRAGRRAAGTLTITALGAAAVVCLPFFAAAPRGMVHQVIDDQLGRTERLTPKVTLFLHQVAGVGQPYRVRGASEGLVIGVLVAAVLAVIIAAWRGPRIWPVLATAQAALVLPQISYTYHYLNFAAPALAACAGIAIGALVQGARRLGRPSAVAAGLAVASAIGLLAWQAAVQDVIGMPLPRGLSTFVKAHRCTFSDYPTALAAAGAETAQVRRGCPNLVDYTGAALSAGNGRMLIRYGHGRPGRWYRPPAWQAQVRRVLAASDAAVLASWRPEHWTPATSDFFHQRFRMAGRAGFFTLWTLRPARGGGRV